MFNNIINCTVTAGDLVIYNDIEKTINIVFRIYSNGNVSYLNGADYLEEAGLDLSDVLDFPVIDFDGEFTVLFAES